MEIQAAKNKAIQYQFSIAIENGETCEMDPASNNCAPYGISPWMTHEKISNKLALLRQLIPCLSAISLLIFPVKIIATVLLATHKLAKVTSKPIHHSPTFGDFLFDK